MVKLYPDGARGAAKRIVADLLAAAWTAASIVAGLRVHDLVLSLRVVATAITDTGRTFNSWIDTFQNVAPVNIPLIGGAISDYLRGLAGSLRASTGDVLVSNGSSLYAQIGTIALGLGVIAGLVPFLAVVVPFAFWRWRDVREMGAAAAFVRMAARTGRVEEARALLAFRAVSKLPFRRLMQVSADPIGDLQSQMYEALAGEMLRAAGLGPARLATPPHSELPVP